MIKKTCLNGSGLLAPLMAAAGQGLLYSGGNAESRTLHFGLTGLSYMARVTRTRSFNAAR